ncbi:MAG TPA: alpha/beta hydrolase [Rhizobacter sp.]|nr:alpha/beta hydrolase [Rhizobacter sp.]
MEIRHSLPAADGHSIELFSWQPAAPARAVVQIAHGMGEHARRYARLANALAAQGIAVYANEHRGHGEAALRAHHKGELGPRGFPGLVADMVSVSDFAQARHPGVPLLLLGHSMGSFAVKVYLLDHAARVAGAALTGTVALDLAEAGNASAWKLADKAAAAPAVVRRTPFDWLSRDEAEVDAYIADPLCGFRLTVKSRQSMYAAYARTTDPAALRRIPSTLPMLFFVGEDDAMNRRLAYFDPLVQRFRDAGLTDISVRLYPGARHEVLNETNRDEVVADFVAWVERVLGQTPSS